MYVHVTEQGEISHLLSQGLISHSNPSTPVSQFV